MEWECGEARRTRRRQQGGRGSGGVALDGVTWAVPAGPPGLAVTAAGLDHRLPCWGYVFQENDEPATAGGDNGARVATIPFPSQSGLTNVDAGFAHSREQGGSRIAVRIRKETCLMRA